MAWTSSSSSLCISQQLSWQATGLPQIPGAGAAGANGGFRVEKIAKVNYVVFKIFFESCDEEFLTWHWSIKDLKNWLYDRYDMTRHDTIWYDMIWLFNQGHFSKDEGSWRFQQQVKLMLDLGSSLSSMIFSSHLCKALVFSGIMCMSNFEKHWHGDTYILYNQL